MISIFLFGFSLGLITNLAISFLLEYNQKRYLKKLIKKVYDYTIESKFRYNIQECSEKDIDLLVAHGYIQKTAQFNSNDVSVWVVTNKLFRDLKK